MGERDNVRYDDRIVRDFLWATIVFGIVGMLVGVIIGVQLIVRKWERKQRLPDAIVIEHPRLAGGHLGAAKVDPDAADWRPSM